MSQAAYRAAAVTFLTDYAASAGVKMQIYPGRPRTINPPTGFVDAIRETYTAFTEHYFQRVPQVDVVVVFGLFDSKDAVEQKDAFVDGFVAWAYANPHESGANTLISVASTEDIPAFVNDWVQPSEQRTYYATSITLEGFGTN
jgi:hypothetical protein